MPPDEVRFALERDARLLVPVGTCEQHGPHLPFGSDTIIVERLADDLSAEFEILRAPTVEYGVNTATPRPFPGNAAVRRKTLHRWMNDLLASWEEAGVDAFIVLTAPGHAPHPPGPRVHGGRLRPRLHRRARRSARGDARERARHVAAAVHRAAPRAHGAGAGLRAAGPRAPPRPRGPPARAPAALPGLGGPAVARESRQGRAAV